MRAPHGVLAAASVRGAGDGVTCRRFAGAIEDGEVRAIALGFEHPTRFGADFDRFAASEQMVVVIGGFQERAGQEREIACPQARIL